MKRSNQINGKYERYNKKRPVLAIRISPLVKKQLHLIAEKKGISINMMIEPVIENWVLEQE